MERAKRWARRIWGWIDNISTVAWLITLVGGTAALGVVYSFADAYRALPLPGQMFFDVAIVSAVGLIVILVAKQFGARGDSGVPAPRAESADRSGRSAAETEADLRYRLGLVELARAVERQRLTEADTQVHELRETRDAFIERDKQAQLERQSLENELTTARPKAAWADGLLAAESSYPHLEQIRLLMLKVDELSGNPPFFEIAICVRYHGVLTMTVTVDRLERLLFRDREFSQPPTVISPELPVTVSGRGYVEIRLRQMVDMRRDELLSALGELRPMHVVLGAPKSAITLRFTNPYNGTPITDVPIIRDGSFEVELR